MKSNLTRRDFLKFGGISAASLAFSPLIPASLGNFDDSNLLRVSGASKTISINVTPSFKSDIYRWCDRDELIHVYGEVVADEPKHNPLWYRVWGGYIHRDRVQQVKTIFQPPVEILEGTRRLAEVTVPFTQPYRFVKTSQSWESLNPPLYYGSVHWVDQLAPQGFDGSSEWYRIFDELDSNVPYFVPAKHLRIMPLDVFDPITPDVSYEKKLIKVNLTTQMLTAYESDVVVFQTNISSGIPGGGGSGPKAISTTTPNGKFEILDKAPSKHMGNSYFNLGEKGNLLADVDNYVLPGVPWTCFFTEVGHAFHGTYWHENFGTPMSHGCINMRSNEANWLFRWARPPHKVDAVSNHTARGTTVEIHY